MRASQRLRREDGLSQPDFLVPMVGLALAGYLCFRFAFPAVTHLTARLGPAVCFSLAGAILLAGALQLLVDSWRSSRGRAPQPARLFAGSRSEPAESPLPSAGPRSRQSGLSQ